MQTYLQTLFLTAAVATLATLLLPEQNPRLCRAAEFGIALFVLCVLCRPLPALLSLSTTYSPPEIDLSAADYTDAARAEAEKAVARGIEADIATRYRIDRNDVSATVTLSLDEEELTIAQLILTLRGSARLLDLVGLENDAKKNYTPQTEVHVA